MRLSHTVHHLSTLALLISTTFSSPISITTNLASPSTSLSLRTTIAPTKRDFTLHGLTLRAVQPFRVILPIAVAAARLEQFYIAVYYKAANEWIRYYPQPAAHFIIRWSEFELSFVSNENAPQGIPWEFGTSYMSQEASHVANSCSPSHHS